MTFARCTTALLALTFSGVAFAQSPQTDTQKKRFVYAQETVVDFDGVDVNVPINRPDLKVFHERRSASFNPMIRLRADFNQEMRESVSDLR